MTVLRRRWKRWSRLWREARAFARTMHSTRHPFLAQIIPIRRCNLACTYCNEFDDFSPPVPTEEMYNRIDRLTALRTAVITFSGGEPLLHPDLDALITRARSGEAIVTVITNGLLLSPDRIRRLNRAGLDYLQISIDNVTPDDVSKKSLKSLDRRLQWLAEYSEFAVTINSVLGSAIRIPEDAFVIAQRARQLGLTSTVGMLHDQHGAILGLDEKQQAAYQRMRELQPGLFSFAQFAAFQRNLAAGQPNDWHCRAGARFLYICEEGKVHYCSQQRGAPGIPLSAYTREDMERSFKSRKGCEPFCSISCVHQVALLDRFREQPAEALQQILDAQRETDAAFRTPASVRALAWLFLDPRRRRIFGKLALKTLGVGGTQSTP